MEPEDPRIEALARKYLADVRARRAAGDEYAEYNAQRPKVEAYRLLLDAGFAPREAVAHFARIVEQIENA